MSGERPTKQSLQLEWQGTKSSIDGFQKPSRCNIAVVGVGGAGCSVVTQLTKTGLAGALKMAVDADSLRLRKSQADWKVLIKGRMTYGKAASGQTSTGRAVAEETMKEVQSILAGANIVFVVASLGGEIGTKISPVVAQIAKKLNAMTIGVVTMPFKEKKDRAKLAREALAQLQHVCETVIMVDKEKMKKLEPQFPIGEAFEAVNQILVNLIKGIVETITSPSLVNLELADFTNIIKQGGVAFVGMGESRAPNRAEEAVHSALKNPLLDVEYREATRALVHVTGDNNMTIDEANRVAEAVTEMMNTNAHVVWGARVNPELDGTIRVTLIVTQANPHRSFRSVGAIAPHLFNIEQFSNFEKKLPLDFGLHQLENF